MVPETESLHGIFAGRTEDGRNVLAFRAYKERRVFFDGFSALGTVNRYDAS